MKYDSHHIDIILASLTDGDGRVRACKKANIDYQTFLDWLKDDRKPEFSEAVKKAEANGNDKIKDLCKRKIIEDKSWQSGAWWLERNYPDEFKDKTHVHHSGEININITDDELLVKLNKFVGSKEKK